MPVLVLAGEEDFELSRRFAELKVKLLDPNWATVNYLRLDNPSLPDLIDAAATLPFGPGNRLVHIDRCEIFTKKRAKGNATTGGATPKKAPSKSKDKDTVDPDDLEGALKSVAENTYVIFCCPYNFDSTLKVAKAVAAVAKIEAFPKEKYWPGSASPKLTTWCQREAHRFGVTIDDEAIEYLLEANEANLRQISSEIQKAAVAAIPKTHIACDLIMAISPHHANVFALADRWIAGDSQEACLSLAELLRQQSGMPILATLQTMLAKWIRLKLTAEKINHELPSGPGLSRRELPLPQLAKQVAHELKVIPFVVEKDLRKIHRIPLDKLIAARSELTRLELLLKTGQMPERHVLEIFALRSPT